MKNTTTKMLGDAGEHYALSQFSFANKPATKMPDNWEGYDLAVEAGKGLVRVSVKTRSETKGWSTNKWFTFDDRKVCDWIVLIFKSQKNDLRSWIIPFEIALKEANKPSEKRKSPWLREISWKKLNSKALSIYESNWDLRRIDNSIEDNNPN